MSDKLTTELLRTSLGEFYPITIDSQVEISIDGKNGTVKDELISINNKFGDYTTTAELPKTYTPTGDLEKNYLKISDAANTYSTINQLNTVDQKFNNYTETTILESNYATIEELNNTNNKFNSYTSTENLQADYLSKNDAAETYLPISALDETVANSVSDYVNSEEMKSLLVTKKEFNQYSNEVSGSFEDVDSNIKTIESNISNLEHNSSMREMWHSYNSETKTHILNFAPPDIIFGSDLELLQYRHYFFITTAPWHPGDKLHINLIDLDLIPTNMLGEDLTEEDIFGEGVIVHITINGNKCFFRSGGTNGLNYKLISGSTYPKSLNSNILYNSYDNSIPGIIKNEDGGILIDCNAIDTATYMFKLPVYLESGKTYTVRGLYDETYGKLGNIHIQDSLSNNIMMHDGTSPYFTFSWTFENNIGYVLFSFSLDVLENIQEVITYYPQINEGDRLLDYEQYRTKENTIWVDTIIDKEAVASNEAEIDGFQLDCYINASTGVVTKPSKNTCYIKYFPCEEGQEYNFKLSNGKTVLIAYFNELPKAEATGTILYGEGKTTNLSSLDYTIVAPAKSFVEIGGITFSLPQYLAIWYYDSEANNNIIPEITITDVTKMNQIIPTLPNEYKINEYAIASTNPWLYYKDVNYIPNSTIIQDKFLNASGEIEDGKKDEAPCYTENYIPVKYGTTYNLNYTLSNKKEMWCRIIEYTGNEGNYIFKGGNTIVNQVQGTSQSKTYTPSTSTVTAIRISWRTFYPSGTTCTFSFIEPNVEFCTATENDLYIETTSDKENSKEINILKKNKIILNLSKALLFIKGKWEEKNFYVFNNKKFF